MNGPLAHRTWSPSEPANAPVALLLHGITGSSATWWRVGPAVADAGWRVIALDLPGHGESPRMEQPMKVGQWALAVRDTVRNLVGERELDFALGHSAGAATVLEVLALEPGIARRVVLEDPPGAGDVSRPDRAEQLEREVAVARRHPEGYARQLRRLNPGWAPQDADETVAALQTCEIDVIAEMERRGMGYRVVELLPTVAAPTLLMLAEEEHSSLADEARQAALNGLAPMTQPVDFPTGHAIHRNAFDGYLATLFRWLGAMDDPA